eukprot:CAMPEP_0172355724 /NCGR_PEP_ID=MMETSP1060-20121228/128_1 /TAXON_ID=37318 /ORGANISM="Pseudo-nitzschia pungens, Strain cf. cingulata" /LENGTH=2200 /DNA_ID=CAMNT_0013075555 /DNA_START=614 /DNA_END=7216 /DNA_ORIENTATION=+
MTKNLPNESARITGNNNNNSSSTPIHHHSNGTGSLHTNSATQVTFQTANAPASKKGPPTEVGIGDPQWREIWLEHKDSLLDPADVHSTLQDLMANVTNRLSDTELLFLQRRVRSIVRQSHLFAEQQSSSNGGKNRGAGAIIKKQRNRDSSGGRSPALLQDLIDTTNIAKNHHLLTAHVLRKVLPRPPVSTVKSNLEFLAAMGEISDLGNTTLDLSNNGNSFLIGDIGGGGASTIEGGKAVSGIRIVESTYLLALYCNDILWDCAADIAVNSAKTNNLEMDVNKQIKSNSARINYKNLLPLPRPTEPKSEEPSQTPIGMGMHALTFILGLALRGSRQQQLNLLFYILFPPALLQSFLENHPAGGVPTWLLEVDQDIVISLASLSHYYWYGGGSANCPYSPSPQVNRNARPETRSERWNQKQHDYALRLSGHDVIHFLMAVLIPEAHVMTDDPSSPKTGQEPISSDDGQNGVNRSPTSSHRKGGIVGFKRRGSLGSKKDLNYKDLPKINGNGSFTIDDSETHETEILNRLKNQRQQSCSDKHTSANTADKINFMNDYCSERSRMAFAKQAAIWLRDHPVQATDSTRMMTILDFDLFCQKALDDGCVSAIMHRLFAQGWIPNPSMELDMVKSRWREWQETSPALSAWSAYLDQSTDDAMEILSQNVRRVLSMGNGYGDESSTQNTTTVPGDIGNQPSSHRKVFGGLGGFDNQGGFGFGVMYCIDKKWWDDWEAYVGWSWAGDSNTLNSPQFIRDSQNITKKRPGELSTEILLDRHDDVVVAGTLGSYELMKSGLRKDIDYVLVPPLVWDVLFEMYAGGPPLPRMVRAPEPKERNGDIEGANENGIELCSPTSSEGGVFRGDIDIQSVPTETDLDAMAKAPIGNKDRVLRIPRLMKVITHPWIIQFQLCDPLQPYRKQDYNEAGPLTIRVMASPDQPLWRLYSEVITRLPFRTYRAYDLDGRGKVRLWKRIDPSGPKDPYGPWPCTLLCKNRYAILPRQNYEKELTENYEELRSNWEEYSDNATVEGSGLTDESQILVEFAIMNRNNIMIWPREAAAKVGRDRRLADKHKKFRRMLLGLNDHGAPMVNPPDLVGLSVDAREERSGRWYEVRITHVKVIDPDTDEENDEDSVDDYPVQGYKEVRVDFTKYGGRAEWIRIPGESGRLASAGRFTMGEGDASPASPTRQTQITAGAANDSKGKMQAQVKKSPQDATETAKVCTIPGYGACGLANLGNTCYINSALQCIGYFPLLRSYLLSGDFRDDLNIDNPLGTKGVLLEEFVDLLRVMWSAKAGEKSPFHLRKQIAKLRPDFAGADQQDAQELLSYVLDALMEDSNRVIKKPYVEGLEDDWVKLTPLSRVGEEAWRRERRRSRSIITDVHTGQTISTTTCPVCNFSSQKFDPFNLLSLPIPTVTDVIFKCKVVRRANGFNTPWILNRPKNKNGKAKGRFGPNKSASSKPPSENSIVEQYIITMSRLADSSDLRLKIQSICGIPASNLTICSAEEKLATAEKDDGSVVRKITDLTPLTNKKGPCSQFAPRQRNTNEESNAGATSPALIIAFESTLRSRSLDRRMDEGSETNYDDSDDEDDIDSPSTIPNPKDERELEKLVMQYGNAEECRLYDTDTLPIAQAVSRSLWPTRHEELKLGLRVDAIDHKKHWYPGSVVEILENEPANAEDEQKVGTTRVKIHFDNFSSKWDETYSIEHFVNGQVQPLYSHANPRNKTTEFVVHHRYMDRSTRIQNLFGQPFYVQCHSEWSTARAGAQILAQASRFLRQSPSPTGTVDVDGAQEREARIDRLYDRTQIIISELIDLLVEGDKEYVRGALGLTQEKPTAKRFRNPGFDAASISSTLVRRVNEKLHRLPFEVRVCTADCPIPGPTNEECAFPFSLMRTIGNYLSARHAIVLQWREPPSDKKSASALPPNTKYSNYLGAPVMYVSPKVIVDEASAEILTKANQKAKKTLSARGSAGMPLGKCLTEFCKVQKLENDEGDTHWRCPRCKDFRPGAKQNLVLWRLPDILTIHMKRFRSSQKWREKITTKVNFPLTGLDMRKWCHEESPVLETRESDDSYVYDLIGVLNHYGGMTGGHYVATCKATPCSKDGREEVAFDFNGVGANMPIATEEETDTPSSWKPFSRTKVEVNENKVTAMATADFQRESVEPLWLQFDDEVVEPMAPKNVISESAYVLFYRRRRLTPANVARYSSLE